MPSDEQKALWAMFASETVACPDQTFRVERRLRQPRRSTTPPWRGLAVAGGVMAAFVFVWVSKPVPLAVPSSSFRSPPQPQTRPVKVVWTDLTVDRSVKKNSASQALDHLLPVLSSCYRKANTRRDVKVTIVLNAYGRPASVWSEGASAGRRFGRCVRSELEGPEASFRVRMARGVTAGLKGQAAGKIRFRVVPR